MKYRKTAKAEIKRKPQLVDQDFLHRDRVVFLIFAAALMLWMIQPRYGRFGWKSNLVINGDIMLPAIASFLILVLLTCLFYTSTRKIMQTKVLIWGILSQVIILIGLFTVAKWPLGVTGLVGVVVSAVSTFVGYLNPGKKYLFYLNIFAGFLFMLVAGESGWLKAAVMGILVQVFLIEPAQKETKEYFQ